VQADIAFVQALQVRLLQLKSGDLSGLTKPKLYLPHLLAWIKQLLFLLKTQH